MIQLSENIAWVEAIDGSRTPFDEERLAESIERAAALVNDEQACLAESIAAAIHLFACECARSQTISCQEVDEMVTEVLATLGHPNASRAYARRAERSEIRLDEMALRGGGFELGFYRLLDFALQVAGDEDLSLVRLHGLRSCVMQLLGARRWGPGCRQLAEEIVTHVRTRISHLRPQGAELLRLAVLE